VEGSYENGTESLGSIRYLEVLKKLHNWHFLMKSSAARS
jgi:hypothetical protein